MLKSQRTTPTVDIKIGRLVGSLILSYKAVEVRIKLLARTNNCLLLIFENTSVIELRSNTWGDTKSDMNSEATEKSSIAKNTQPTTTNENVMILE